MAKKYYLAGPMSGLPQFNFPAFAEAAAALRAEGHEIVSPAELDATNATESLKSQDGAGQAPEEYWKLLSAGVEKVGRDCDGIILLPDWYNSRGAKIEAMVGLVAELDFFYYQSGQIYAVPPTMIRSVLGVRTNVNYQKPVSV